MSAPSSPVHPAPTAAAVQPGASTASATSEAMQAADPSTLLASGLFQLLLPVVQQLEQGVDGVKHTQNVLKANIDSLAAELRQFSEQHATQQPVNLDVYVKKLITARRRITSVNNTLQEVQTRVTKLQQSIAKEAKRKKDTLETVTAQATAATAKRNAANPVPPSGSPQAPPATATTTTDAAGAVAEAQPEPAAAAPVSEQ